jgi:hypothetical protein
MPAMQGFYVSETSIFTIKNIANKTINTPARGIFSPKIAVYELFDPFSTFSALEPTP